MNSLALAIGQLPPETVAFCTRHAEFAFKLGRWFVYLALVIAVVETLAAIALAFMKPANGPAPANADAAAKLLEALKGVLEALVKLPRWVAIFLAGLALLWIAGEGPGLCDPAPPPGEQAPAPPPKK